MAQFSFAYNHLRESFMAFTHQHSYDAFQEWYNGCPYIEWVWGYYGGIFEGASYSSPQEENAEREWESFLLRTAKIFDTLADCTDWHESVPYFYENFGNPEETLRHFFSELEESERIKREASLGEDYFPF